MKCMRRNMVVFYYAIYEGRESIRNPSGKATGETKVKHGNPIQGHANISAAKGETQTRQFGENEVYDKVIVLDNDALPIDEYSVLWVDTVPQLNEDGSLAVTERGEIVTPYDYIVKKVAKSINTVSIAISKVNVRG